MKNPFKKADSAKLPEQGRERTEIDYAHRTIIHHMLYGYPGDFSSSAGGSPTTGGKPPRQQEAH